MGSRIHLAYHRNLDLFQFFLVLKHEQTVYVPVALKDSHVRVVPGQKGLNGYLRRGQSDKRSVPD